MMKFVLSMLFLGTLLLPFKANAQTWSEWHYHVDFSVQPQADDSFDAVYADFTHLLKSTFKTTGVLNEKSIRVVSLHNAQPAAPVPYRFAKAPNYDSATNAAGTLVFEVAGTKEPGIAKYWVYFDTKANGTKPAFQNSTDIPKTANMIWNGGFETLAKNYSGANRYGFKGENIPQGWWGNLRNIGITNNIASSTHSGKHAMGIVTAKEKTHVSISTAPSPPGLRVVPGQSYLFSFWVKGTNLTSEHPLTTSIYWYGENGKYLRRISISTPIAEESNFDWKENETIIVAPEDAYFGTMRIGTYSKTGVLTIDDVSIRVAVPPLLQ